MTIGSKVTAGGSNGRANPDHPIAISMASALAKAVARLGAPRPRYDRLHFAGAVFGLLVVVHLGIMVDRGFDRGCFGFSAPTPVVECEAVTQSDAGRLLGVSNATWGLVYYGLLIALGLLAGVLAPGGARWWRPARAAAVTVGFAYSLWLVYVQYAELGGFCKLCLLSAATVAFLFALVATELFSRHPHSSAGSMHPTRFYGAVALVAVVLVVADLSYFSGLEPAFASEPPAASSVSDSTADPPSEAPGTDPASAVPGSGIFGPVREPAPTPIPLSDECAYDESIPAVEDFRSLIQMGDPVLGNASGPVVVMEFFDPNCPHCRTMHPAFKRVIETHGDTAAFYLVPFMLWPDISMLPIEALYVAAQEGKYIEMLEAQFMRQNPKGFTAAQLRDMAVEIGLDGGRFADRLSRGLNRRAIVQRAIQLREIGLRGTPSVMINGRVVASESKTIACLRRMIDEAAGS